jgi:uncharacterized spore protein YtfJ
MDMKEFVGQAQDSMTVRRVFGERYAGNGVTLIPAARIRGAVGGGGGDDKSSGHEAKGSGGGLMMRATLSGAYVIRGDEVTWMPSIDVNRLVLGFQVTTIVALVAWAARGAKARPQRHVGPKASQWGRKIRKGALK